MRGIEQVIGTYKLENGTSEIGIGAGGIVYIENNSDVFNGTWYMTEDENFDWHPWIFQYEDGNGELNITRVDWLLHGLLNTEDSCGPPSVSNAVAKNATARKWVNDLNEAQERVSFWFSSGCPTTKEEQQMIIEWSNIDNPASPWECHRQNTANQILKMQVTIKAQQAKLANEEPGKDTRS